MHCAPSVSYPVGRSRKAERLLMLFWALGAASVSVACLASSAPPDWRQVVLAASALVAGAAAWTGVLRSSAPAELRFDGRIWSYSGVSGRHGVETGLVLDLQSLMLVRLSAPGRSTRWAWLDSEASPASWPDLRRAIHARQDSLEPAAAASANSRSAHHSSS